MLKRIGRWLDPILLIGLFISMTISVVMVLTGSDTLSSFIVGLLSTVITLLIDLIARIQKVESTVLEVGEMSRILTDDDFSSSLQNLARSYDTISEYNFDHYLKIANGKIAECKAALEEIASGSVLITSKSIYEYSGYAGVKQARQSIKSVHPGSVSQMDFWRSDAGKKYLKAHQTAIERGVRITRIFALTK